nr:hypothetical protein [Tanacetum cinerariifolium]
MKGVELIDSAKTKRFERQVDVTYIYNHTRRYFPATLYYVACRETQYLLLNVKHDSKGFIINANHIYVAESYALGSAIVTEGYMVIEEETAVLDARIGSTVEDLKCDGLF